jgi:uncharacterized LabA/DUF88 family protein
MQPLIIQILYWLHESKNTLGVEVMSKKMKVPVIVDEMNIVHQNRSINVSRVSWTSFFSAIQHTIKCSLEPYFVCSNANDNPSFAERRESFFDALRQRNIKVLEGFSVLDSSQKRLEKGVDVLVALQIYKEALNGAKDIIVCSADSDLVPAILEAQKLGARVHVVISSSFPGYEITQIADTIISLEDLLLKMEARGNIKYVDTEKPGIRCNKRYYQQRLGNIAC